MRIVEVNAEIRNQLRKSGLSTQMGSLEYCDFLVIIEHEGKIIGASGIGGLLNVISLQIHPNFLDKGLGGKLLDGALIEAKKRNYSFVAASRDPENKNAVRLHDHFGVKPVFQIKYGLNFTRDIIFLEFKSRGKIIRKFLSVFNNKIGMIFLVTMIKIFRKSLFKVLLTYPPEEFPEPDVKYAIKNFKKLI